MKMMRCKAPIQIHLTGTTTRVEFVPPMDVDLDRELAPGFTVADAIEGREDCFEPVPVEPDTK
jgi:hypothetical protein